METKNRNLWIILIVILVVICICLAAVCAVVGGLAAVRSAEVGMWANREQDRSERSFEVGDAPSLQIENFAGNVNVRAGDGSQGSIYAHSGAGTGVIDSIRQGYGMVRRNLRDAAVMWFIMFGLGIAWVIVLIPVVLLLLLVGAVLGGVPALVVGGLASLFTQGAVPWILAALVGLPILIIVLVVPLAFLGGLWQVFQSSVWTLTYRELRALERAQP